MFSPFQQGPGSLHVVDGPSTPFVPVLGTQRRVIVSATKGVIFWGKEIFGDREIFWGYEIFLGS